jgi:hypothetical protein
MRVDYPRIVPGERDNAHRVEWRRWKFLSGKVAQSPGRRWIMSLFLLVIVDSMERLDDELGNQCGFLVGR